MAMSLAARSGRSAHRIAAAPETCGAAIDVPDWLAYGFQCVQPNGRTAFRYDNAPHLPDLETFPDHKHLGARERPIAHPRPTIQAIVREILDIVDEPDS